MMQKNTTSTQSRKLLDQVCDRIRFIAAATYRPGDIKAEQVAET